MTSSQNTSVFKQALVLALQALPQRKRLFVAQLLLLLAVMFYPTDLSWYQKESAIYRFLQATEARPSEAWSHDHVMKAVMWVENEGRFVATAAQIIMPIVLLDKVGMAQLIYAGIATTVATHSLKSMLDDLKVADTKLGERPYGGTKNMPSGHSSMAASALWFVGSRYGWRHLYYLLPLLLATMAARIFLEAHTFSAVFAGALLGMLCTGLFTTRRNAGVA